MLTVHVRRHGGVPTLFVNGRPHTGMMWFGRPNTAADFARAGVHLCDFILSATEGWWIGPGKYDFQAIDRLVDDFIAADPKIRLMPRIQFGYTDMAWWAQQHPQELSQGRDIDGEPLDYFATAKNDIGCPFSFSSRRFLADASKALAALVTHLESRDRGQRFFGYHIAGGISNEWFAWWTYVEGATEDYSEPSRAAFRDWLRLRYRNSRTALRAAWRRPQETFDTADIPTPRMLNEPKCGILRDSGAEQPAIDYLRFFGAQGVNMINALCGVARRACRRRKLVGSFGGYMFPHWNNLCAARQAHAGLRELLKARNVDFICAPYQYDHRGVDGVHYSQTLVDAIHRAGKLHLDEIDTFTHLTRWPWNSLTTIRHAKTPAESRRILRRDAGYLLAKGGAAWWMDLIHQRWHGHPRIIRTIRESRQAAEALLHQERRSVSQIAVFVDDEASLYMRPDCDLPYGLLTAQRQFELSRIGAPFDELLLTDLQRRDLPDYRVCIFPNAWRMTPELRQAIERYVKRDYRWSVWFYGAGVCSEPAPPGARTRSLDLEAGSELIGMHLRSDTRPRAARVQLLPTARLRREAWGEGPTMGLAAEVLRGVVGKGLREYGAPLSVARQRDTIIFPNPNGWQKAYAPVFYVDDPRAATLGMLAGTRRTGLALRSSTDWTSVHSAAPCLPATLIRNIARAAGVDLWAEEGAVVCANDSFVSVKSERGNPTLQMPDERRVVSLSGHTIRQVGQRVWVQMPRHDTVWLALD